MPVSGNRNAEFVGCFYFALDFLYSLSLLAIIVISNCNKAVLNMKHIYC